MLRKLDPNHLAMIQLGLTRMNRADCQIATFEENLLGFLEFETDLSWFWLENFTLLAVV